MVNNHLDWSLQRETHVSLPSPSSGEPTGGRKRVEEGEERAWDDGEADLRGTNSEAPESGERVHGIVKYPTPVTLYRPCMMMSMGGRATRAHSGWDDHWPLAYMYTH